MSDLLLRTKLTPPLVPQALVTRQPLLDRLEEGHIQGRVSGVR